MVTEKRLRDKLVQICRMLHQKNLIAAMDGNVSVKFGDGLLTTPSGVNKGFLEEDQILLVDWNGRVIEGEGQPTSELAMHLAPVATAFSIAGISLEDFVLPEVVLTLGVIPTASYATPTTAEVPETIRNLIQKHDALILERHGAITVGRDLMDAYNKMEKLEHAAIIIFSALQLGRVRCLPPREVEKLIHLKLIQKLQSS